MVLSLPDHTRLVDFFVSGISSDLRDPRMTAVLIKIIPVIYIISCFLKHLDFWLNNHDISVR